MKYVLLVGQDYEGCQYEKSFNEIHDILEYYFLNELGDFGKVYDTDKDECIGIIYTLEKLDKVLDYRKRVAETYRYEYMGYETLDTFENILMIRWG